MSEFKVYALIEWSFGEASYLYYTTNLEVAKEWEQQEHSYGYFDYEELELYDGGYRSLYRGSDE